MEHDEMNKYGQIEVYPYGKPPISFARWTISTKEVDPTDGRFKDTLTVAFGSYEMTVEQAREYARKIGALCDMAEQANGQRG